MTGETCRVPECSKPRHAMSFCHLHYVQRMRATTASGGPQPPWCGVANCDEPHYSKGLCADHDRQLHESIH